LIAQLGANQGLTKPETDKMFQGMAGVYRVALSVRNNQVVAMITGHVADPKFPGLDASWKAVSIGPSTVLVGHVEAVDQALQRMSADAPSEEINRMADAWPADREFWAVGSAALAGPQATNAGLKRFSLSMSIRDRLTSNAAFEFDKAPDENALRVWPSTPGGSTVDGNVVNVKASMDAAEVDRRLVEIAASPVGQQLSELIKVARLLPVRDTTPKAKPVIYGLDKQ
jgi:hypothetical protein